MIDLLTILVLLSWVNLEKWECITEWDKISIARYYPKTDTLEYCNEVTYQAMVHETGHRVYYKNLTRAERKQWKELYNKCDKKECFVNEYAKTMIEEDFAETFRLIDKSYSNETIKEKQEFIRRLIFY